MEVRNNGYALTMDMLGIRAQAMARVKNIPHNNFKASAGWVQRFLKQKGLFFQRRTTLYKRLPENKVVNFDEFHWPPP